jgi:serine/threonine-protein kinase HipA
MTFDDNDIMDAYTVVFDGLIHLGPGDPDITQGIAENLRPSLPSAARVADLGCGVGASVLVLAQTLPGARVLALDLHAPFIDRLRNAAQEHGLGDRIDAVVGDMGEPPILDGTRCGFDLIWSESAIYSIGRSEALKRWYPWLRPNGWLVFSDIIWQHEANERSAEAISFWTNEYPQISTPDAVMVELNTAGFNAHDPVICSRNAWSNYYEPLRARLARLSQLPRTQALKQLIAELESEIAVYDRARDDVALAFFSAQRD